MDSHDNLYIADGGSSRVLRFAHAGTAASGDAATAAFGQPTLTSLVHNNGGVSATSLFVPASASVSADGDLYVADRLNHRVLRYADAATAVTGTAAVGVFGQSDFTTATVAVTASKLNSPYDASVDAAGNLWVADSGNNRVLRYDAAGLVTAPGPAASAVLGQGGVFTTGTAATTAEGLGSPRGVALDVFGNVYVADYQNSRVLRFEGGSPGIPTPPTDLVATPGNASVSISFTAPAGSISNYEYSIDDGAHFTAFLPADDSSPVTITGLSGGVTYAVRLRAVGIYGVGAASDAVSATPIAAIAGSCGAAHEVATASAPSAQLCATGVAGSVSSTGGQWAWTCTGTGGSDIDASCGALFQTQTLSLSANPASIAVGASSTVTASSTSGLTPSLSLTSGTDCTLGDSSGSGTVTASVTAVNAGGSCTVQATRAISPDGCTSCYQAAEPASTTITLTKANQTITFGAAPTGLVVGGATGTVSATASSGLSVSFSNGMSMFCGVSGSTVTGLRAGTCTVLANQAGNANYNLAPQVSQDIVIGRGSQAITAFAATPSSLSAGTSAALSATGGASGNAVGYTSGTPSICSVSGGTVSGLAVGTCTVIANQAGNADYEAAPPASIELAVTVGSQVIGHLAASPSSLVVDGGSASLSAIGGGSGNAVSYGSSTPSICTVSGSTVTPLAAGICTVVASQDGNDNYADAGPATLSIDVARGSQTIASFASSVDSLRVNRETASLSASGGVSGTAVRFASATPEICSVTGETVTAIAAGTCTVTVDQDGNANYEAAATQTLAIAVTADTGEDAVPSSGGAGSLGDGNGDDIADSEQDDVASLPTLTGDSFATIASDSGRTLSRVTTVPVPDDFPSTSRAPLSGLAFTLNQTEASETIELYFPASDGVVGLRKRNRSTGVYDRLPVTVTRIGNKTRIRFTLTDGGDYDSDGEVDGTIVDPVFPVTESAASGGGSAGWLTLLLLPLSLLALARRRRAGRMAA